MTADVLTAATAEPAADTLLFFFLECTQAHRHWACLGWWWSVNVVYYYKSSSNGSSSSSSTACIRPTTRKLLIILNKNEQRWAFTLACYIPFSILSLSIADAHRFLFLLNFFFCSQIVTFQKVFVKTALIERGVENTAKNLFVNLCVHFN